MKKKRKLKKKLIKKYKKNKKRNILQQMWMDENKNSII